LNSLENSIVREPDPQDTLLVIRCQLGEKPAWDDLIHRWHRRLWRFVLSMLSDQAAAEDVLQTIWLGVVRSLGRLRNPERFEAWLYGIARRTIADRFRETYRNPPSDQAVEVAEIDQGIELLCITDAIDTGLKKLHAADREAVVLHYLAEIPIPEVAEICGVPPGTIKSRLHRARRIIRESLNTERSIL
jgi:RNA polymerase sigma factor (sigma-70 family)